jgi:oligogalacturonide lyase
MNVSWTRRGFLSALAAGPERKLSTAPSELRRFRDPATEFELLRLTDPSKAIAVLPGPPNRVATRGGGLIYCSDRSGAMQVWRMDVKSGASQQLTNAEALSSTAVTLLGDDKTLAYMDGARLMIGDKRHRVAYTVENGWTFAGNLCVGDDGNTAVLSETRNGRYRMRVIGLKRGGSAATLFEAGEPLRYCRVRPKRPGILYNHNGVLTLVSPDGRGSKRLATAQAGQAGFALWSADGRALYYLQVPEGRGSVQLREHLPESGEDRLIANTTQFTTFDCNADASVFVGASGSKASPYVLLLVRSGRREMTLAEHKASSPERAVVAFSANSQRLYYGTDREGKPAIYSIALEKFVEDTDSQEGDSPNPHGRRSGRP